ncbi:MAG: hypothetical protein HYZ38_03830 [Mycobacterium sp.]|nr:hypothetical protein [Mycobacterium sp.]
MTSRPDEKLRRRPLLMWGIPGAVIALLLVAATLFDDVWREKPMSVPGNVVSTADREQLFAVQRTRVFFGHQSVGENILDGVSAVYQRSGITAPPIEENATTPGPEGGFISHAFIGENGNPLLKIQDFADTLRGGLAERIDVALMKFCFIDINSRTDVDALFAAYRDTISALERDYPGVTFVHVTMPLTTDSSIKNRIKIMLGGDDSYGQGENVARERYNELLRAEYGDRHLFDLAAVESTAPSGERTQLRYRDQPYYALQPGYASDMGHLNAAGSEIAATAFLQAIADAGGR